jgi:hypothetical protein
MKLPTKIVADDIATPWLGDREEEDQKELDLLIEKRNQLEIELKNLDEEILARAQLLRISR